MGKTLVIARHAERLDSVDAAWASTSHTPYDPPLSPKGHVQAAQMASDIAAACSSQSVAVLSSPYLRCVQTALAIAMQTKSRLRLCAAIGEWMTPDYFEHAVPPSDDGLASLVASSYNWILMQSPEARQEYLPYVDFLWDPKKFGSAGNYGEDWFEMYDRAHKALDEIVNVVPDEVVVIVSHGAICNALIGVLRHETNIQEVPVASWQRLKAV